ncbi:putative PGPS/D10 protein [Cucumis melo var. makuwa]|uniref:Putative PGPS/D10 protein n=1 Tax=Cucumis melo var. makuwa TaxID=1194695 RepID=A0A5D3D753_CUCMM|nr:putative PGPS/D10 protein [Cucumis melo var. makuwa]
MDPIRTDSKQTKTNCKTPTSKSAMVETEFDDLKKNAHLLMSPTALSRMTKSPSIKSNCLCSPTTHIGSFRCRRHRSTAMSRGASVGSNLSDLGQKSETMED